MLADLPFALSAPWVAPSLAVIVGLVVGMLLRWASGNSGRVVRMLAALLLSAAAMLGCKYGIVAQSLNQSQTVRRFEVENADVMISVLANDVKAEWRNAGRSVPGAARQDDPTAPWVEQYSPELWAEAKSRWEALSSDEQLARIDQHERQVNEIWALDAMNKERALDWETFQKSLVPLDAAWLGIAAVLAMVLAGTGRSPTPAAGPASAPRTLQS